MYELTVKEMHSVMMWKLLTDRLLKNKAKWSIILQRVNLASVMIKRAFVNVRLSYQLAHSFTQIILHARMLQ